MTRKDTRSQPIPGGLEPLQEEQEVWPEETSLDQPMTAGDQGGQSDLYEVEDDLLAKSDNSENEHKYFFHWFDSEDDQKDGIVDGNETSEDSESEEKPRREKPVNKNYRKEKGSPAKSARLARKNNSGAANQFQRTDAVDR